MVRTRQHAPRVPYLAPSPLGIEVMTFARLRAITPPDELAAAHRPAFHLLLLVTAGSATHTVDFREHRLTPRRGLWVRPGQVQRFSGARPRGDLVLFRPDVLIPGSRAAALADDRAAPAAFTRSAAVDRALAALRREHEDAPDEPETLRHLLSVLVLKLGIPDTARHGPAALDARLRDLVERDFAAAHDVGHYARKLGYSPRTLGRATKAAAGETPKQVIQGRIALEARRLLAHSDLPVSAIGLRLGFRDPSNFTAFFAHATGETPTAFRRDQRFSADASRSGRRGRSCPG
jgi:AraC-like DNA-binding protein